jgi:transposase
MSLPPRTITPIPEDTAQVARAAFPHGNVYMQMRDEFGSLYTDEMFADLYPKDGQPALRPWRLAWVTVMQFAENLSDRQAADAVRDRIAWKYALSLELSDSGFDFSVLSEFRQRLLMNEAGLRVLDEMLKAFRAKGYVKARGQQRTDSTHVLAAVRELNRLEHIGTTLRYALNSLAMVAPDWLRAQVPPEWFERYGPRFEPYRMPKSEAQRHALTEQVGADGYQLLMAIDTTPTLTWLREVPAVEILRQVWDQQFVVTQEQVRLRKVTSMPPSGDCLRSPFDVEARYCTRRQMGWVGYRVHLTETCDPDYPQVITHVKTTLASVQDSQVTSDIQDDLARANLLPAEHLVDAGYVDTPHLVHSHLLEVDLIGPAPLDTSWQARTEGGLDQSQFIIHWETQTVSCPAGQSSVRWLSSRSHHNAPVFHALFDPATCQACDLRARCTRTKYRRLTLRPRPQYEALQVARQREQTEAFKTVYRKRAGVEGTISQAIRTSDLRQSRYIGLEKTHFQNLAIATALNLERVVAWLNDTPLAPTRKSRFAALAAY